jgi:hypothetical protein
VRTRLKSRLLLRPFLLAPSTFCVFICNAFVLLLSVPFNVTTSYDRFFLTGASTHSRPLPAHPLVFFRLFYCFRPGTRTLAYRRIPMSLYF